MQLTEPLLILVSQVVVEELVLVELGVHTQLVSQLTNQSVLIQAVLMIMTYKVLVPHLLTQQLQLQSVLIMLVGNQQVYFT